MIGIVALWAGLARAESWCAVPLVVHEWGVHVVRVDGGEPVVVPLPSWFHDGAAPGRAEPAPVRDLPADSGVRALPVVQFYVGPGFGPDAPVALEVGFRDGSASSWWPAVDRRVSAAAAGSVAAVQGRERLLAARAARQPGAPEIPLGPDPTKQLGWDRLALTGSSASPPRPPEQDWVAALRRMPGAAWVSRGAESDRFVYYEARTREAPDVTVVSAGTTAGGPRYGITNRSDYDLHEVMILAGGRVWTAPRLPPGASTVATLDRPVDRDALLAWLRGRWVDLAGPPEDVRWDADACVMMRDPAVPVEQTAGHRLYEAELDVILDLWAARLLDGDAPRVVYREDAAALDARMPLSVYTDMYHHVVLHRLGITVVEGGAWGR